MGRICSIVMILWIFTLFSCKDDKGVNLSADANQIEKDYFDDYNVPEHKWGFIDDTGMIVVEPIFDDLGDMRGRLTTANYKGKWGYINIDGKMIIDPEYKQAYDFIDSRAIVQTFDNAWLIIDDKGDKVSDLEYESVKPPLLGVSVVTRGVYKGLIDKNGKQILKPVYDKMIPIDAQTYIVEEGQVYSVVNDKGVKLTSGYDRIYRPFNGRMRVKLDGKYGYLNTENYSKIGKIEYDKAFDFNDVKTIVTIDGQSMFIDHNLKRQIGVPYEKVGYIGEGMWKYKSKGKWGLLNSDGQAVSSAKFDLLNKFSEGLVAYSIGELWGFANNLGLKSIPAKYQLVWDFHKEKARVIDQRGVGFIDKSGNMVVSDIFMEVRDFHQGKARFQTY